MPATFFPGGLDKFTPNLEYWATVTADDVKQLLADGADLNERGKIQGFLPLHYAVKGLDQPGAAAAVIKALIDGGADVNAGTDFTGSTPLHLATSNDKCSLEVLEALVACGATDVTSCRNKFGDTPLHNAAMVGHADAVAVMRWLLDRGCDPNAINDDNETALHNTAFGARVIESDESPKLAQMLLDAGCDASVVNKRGLTALRKAEINKCWKVVAALRRRRGQGLVVRTAALFQAKLRARMRERKQQQIIDGWNRQDQVVV